jgi:hypothetical protein
VWVKRENARDESDGKMHPVLVLSVPALAIHVKLLDLAFPAYCRTQIFAAAQRLSVSCSSAESTFTFTTGLEDNALVTRGKHRSYDGNTSHVVDETTAPCNARLTLHKFRFRDPRWARMGGECSSRCADVSEDCSEPCYERLTDATGELTEEGARCSFKCTGTAEARWDAAHPEYGCVVTKLPSDPER